MQDHVPGNVNEFEGGPFEDFSRALTVQVRCIGAIVIRDIMMRYGRNNLGFLWFIIEPMILCCLVMFLFSHIEHGLEHGMTIVSFFFTGYMPLTLWRHMHASTLKPSRTSGSLMYHRNITVLDVVFGRLTMEFLGTTSALLVIFLVLWTAGFIAPPVDPSLALLGWLEMTFFSVATAVLIAALTEWSETTEHFIQPINYILIPISGYLVMVAWLPTYAQKLIMILPWVHIYEMYRGGFFGTRVETHYWYWYPPAVSLVLLTVGLGWLESLREKMSFN